MSEIKNSVGMVLEHGDSLVIEVNKESHLKHHYAKWIELHVNRKLGCKYTNDFYAAVDVTTSMTKVGTEVCIILSHIEGIDMFMVSNHAIAISVAHLFDEETIINDVISALKSVLSIDDTIDKISKQLFGDSTK